MSKRTDYKNQYAKENYDRVGLMLPKGMKAELLNHISVTGDKSINAFVMRVLALALKADEAKSDDNDNDQKNVLLSLSNSSKEYEYDCSIDALCLNICDIGYSDEYKQLIERKYGDGEDVEDEFTDFDEEKMFVEKTTGRHIEWGTAQYLAEDFSKCLGRLKSLLEIFGEFCPNLSDWCDWLDEFDINFDDTESYYKNCMQ